MKTYSKTHLPKSIMYRGKELKMNSFISGAMNASDTKPDLIAKTLRQQGRIGVLVLVLSKNLKGVKDQHGKPYQPTKFIFSN